MNASGDLQPRLSYGLPQGLWDRTGGNEDRLTIAPGQTSTLADISGAGCVNHIWITAANDKMGRTADALEPDVLRKVLLRMYWDGEEKPSVIVPLGDFFGTGRARTANFASHVNGVVGYLPVKRLVKLKLERV